MRFSAGWEAVFQRVFSQVVKPGQASSKPLGLQAFGHSFSLLHLRKFKRGVAQGLNGLQNEGHGFKGCEKTHVLCQGTTLVGPYTMPLVRALAPEFLLSWSAQSLSAASLVRGAGFQTRENPPTYNLRALALVADTAVKQARNSAFTPAQLGAKHVEESRCPHAHQMNAML
jgi:hypothetical protein